MVDKVVTALLPIVIKLIADRLLRPSDRRLAMILLADSLKLRAYAQAKHDASKHK